MTPPPAPLALVFWRTAAGREPVRDWLRELSIADKRVIGRDIAKVQYGWPIGMPLCRPIGTGLWEIRSTLHSKREARVFIGFYDGRAGGVASDHQEGPESVGRRPRAGAGQIEGARGMVKKNPHIGSSFESWLDEEGLREEVTAAAIKAVVAEQLAKEMKKKKITKQHMAKLMNTSRAQLDRLLDPNNGSATIESLQRAARIVGRDLSLRLV